MKHVLGITVTNSGTAQMTLSLFSLNMDHVSVSHTCIGLYTQINKALKGGNILYIKYSLTVSKQ